MKKVAVLATILITITSFSLEILHDLNVGQKLALIEGKKLIVAFELKTCPYCHKMNEHTFQDPEVEKLIRANYVLVVLFFDEKTRPLFEKFRISSVPTLWFFKYDEKREEWKPLTYLPGYLDPKTFSKVLRYVYQEVKGDFKEYVSKEDDFVGEKILKTVTEEEAEFVLKNDPYALEIEKIEDFKTPFYVYLTRSEDLAKELSQKAYRVLLVK